MKYELAIAHRVCPVLAKTAAFYTDKLAMVKDTTTSLARALKGIRTRLVVILDGCPSVYEQLFDNVFCGLDDVHYERLSTMSIGNHATYAKQIEVLEGLRNDAEFLYFSEDDYLYSANAFREMMALLCQPGVDFVSPLDHPDAYLPYGEASRASCVRLGHSCHWRKAGTTCCTFMLKSETYLNAMKGLSYYSNGGSDYIMWLGLTKFGVFSILNVVGGTLRYMIARINKCTMNGQEWFWIIPLLAWLKVSWRLILGKRFSLWTPLPSLATHLCVPSLPPYCSYSKREDP